MPWSNTNRVWILIGIMSLSVAMGGKYLPCGNADDFRNECTSALGMQSGLIPDSNISASSEWDNNHRAENARLDFVPQAGRTRGAWSAKINNQNQWLQVDFGAELKLTQVATQGRFDYDQWVTRYAISYSRDGIFWNKYKKELEGNRDQSSKVTNALCEEIYARFVRVHPIEWHNHISMRVELYGCKSGITISPIQCRRTLGMESKAIPDSRMRASSIWDLNHGADRSRLNTVRQGNKRGAWSARHNNVGQWIEVAFPQAVKITGIATQGRQDVNQWVRKYKLQYSLNGDYFEDYNGGQTFTGNTDRNTIVGNLLEPAIVVKGIRIQPVTWHGHISMRFELYGCSEGFPLPDKLDCPESSLLLKDSQLSSSSQFAENHGPGNGILHHQPGRGRTGAWSSAFNDEKQWLQVDLGEISKITVISTQGRADYSGWVKFYSVAYIVFGNSFKNVMDGDSIKVFEGNTDRHTVVSHKLNSPIIALLIRFHPKCWNRHISMRVGLFGCTKGFESPKQICNVTLGLESGLILDSQLSASSEWNRAHRAANARLNFVPEAGRTGAWSARHNNLHQWLKIDFGRIAKINKLATQGRSDSDQWVTRYTLSYSRYGILWDRYHKELEGNTDRSSVVTNDLTPNIYARFVRVHPIAWHHHISLRVEFYGCRAGLKAPPIQCRRPLGMESNAIPDSRMRASSIYDSDHGADRSRLNTVRQGNKRGAWSARHNNVGQWIEVAFPQAVKITGIATQGRQDVNQWVRKYKLQYSLNGDYFEDYNGGQTFTGNTDRKTIIGNLLEPAIVVKAIRIQPVAWHGHISMRFELYGCSEGFPLPDKLDCPESSLLLTDSQLSSSSQWDEYHGPGNAILHHQPGRGRTGAWSSRDNDNKQWLQVDLGEISKVTIISTQGRAGYQQWVKSYSIVYSVFGDEFHTVMDGDSNKEFSGNFNQHEVVSHRLDSPIIAQYMRFHPTRWHAHISMRVGIFGCKKGFYIPQHKCGLALGLESGFVRDSQFSASSEWDSAHQASSARLHFVPRLGRAGGWRPWHSNRNQWLKIDLGEIAMINKLATQGSSSSDQWVTRFMLFHRRDGKFWERYPKEFEGNRDSSTVKINTYLRPTIYARFVRIHPIAWHNHISMRVELYGCRKDFWLPPFKCRHPLGMENKTIPDSRINASSIWDLNHGADRSRLNTVRQGNKRGAWSAKDNNVGQWIEVEFPEAHNITGIATQGRQDVNQWVTSYKLQYSHNGDYFEDYNGGQTFTGNTDRNTIVYHLFYPSIVAKAIRIRPTSWHGHISMRFELYGCDLDIKDDVNSIIHRQL